MAATIIRGSLLSRDDAISRDYTIAFTMGPEEISDTSLGIYVRVWRTEADYDVVAGTGRVLLTRQNDEGTGWRETIELFNYEGAPIREVDLAFDQNGNVVVAGDRLTGAAGESRIWLYWFSPTAGNFVFEDLTTGRTPRLLLDAPESIDDSDLLVFYLNDTNQRVEYRVQRELYDEAHLVPVDQWYDPETGANILQNTTVNLFLEEVARSKDYRLHVIASLHNPVTGRYQLLITETVPYPIYPNESFEGIVKLSDAEIVTYIIGVDNAEFYVVATQLTGMEAPELIINFSPPANDLYKVVAELGTLNRLENILTGNQRENWKVSNSLSSMLTTTYIIVTPTALENWKVSASLSTLNKATA